MFSEDNLQNEMWRAFERGEDGLEDLANVLAAGADPDNREQVLAGGAYGYTLLEAICTIDLNERSDAVNAKMADLCFINGADVDFNREHSWNFRENVLTYEDVTRLSAVLLANMAVQDLEKGKPFDMDVDYLFGGVAPCYPQEVDQNERLCAERGIQANQHAFVDYVAMSESYAASFLNGQVDHPDAHWWTEKMELPDHTEYSRPHPDKVRRDEIIGELQMGVIADTFDAFKEGRDFLSKRGLSEIHKATDAEIQHLLEDQNIPRSWRPDETFSVGYDGDPPAM